ncbi:MAG: hypothetical protein IJP70_06035 [Bacteroidales bacterium]|nr:hypothetical protein [Bacteroidales bacterium]
MSLATPKHSHDRYWYVLLHLDPSLIEKLLHLENKKRKEEGKQPLLVMIPYLFLDRATVVKDQSSGDGSKEIQDANEVDESNMMRRYLHNFVFVQGTEMEIDQLLRSEWNQSGRLHLCYYKNKAGVPIRISEKEMIPFIALFVEHRQRFSFRPYGEDTLQARTVRIKKGLFKNYSAVVQEAVRTDNGFKLTLHIPVFSNEAVMVLYDYSDADVDIPGGEIEQVFGSYFVQNMEDELFAILRRRALRKKITADQQEADNKRLESYSLFDYLKFEDTASQSHFQALMLLCATLRRDAITKNLLIQQLQVFLPDPDHPATDEEAFITAMLFVATRKGSFRKSAKDYCQARNVTSESLLHLMPLVKELQMR